jgi:hypothetical protein
VARHVGANGAAALWICVLNPLVIIHLMGGVHNEMLMVGLMMAGIALTFDGHRIWGIGLDRGRRRRESHSGTGPSVHGVGVDASPARRPRILAGEGFRGGDSAHRR